MSTVLVIWGAGGHGKVVCDIAQASGRFEQIVFLDDDLLRAGLTCCDCLIAGGPEQLPKFAGANFTVAVGHNRRRAQCFDRAIAAGLTPATLVHKTATVAPSAFIGP